jgi:cytochrome P450
MADTLEPQQLKASANLKNLPGESGLPFIGHTLTILKNSSKFSRGMIAKYGNLYRTNSFFRDIVQMMGPEYNEIVLMDKGKNFSSEKGWAPWLARLFPRGLMLMDFDHHKAHRHIMAAAFKTSPMRGYMERLNDEMPERIKAWGKEGHFAFYPAIKQLSLDMASSVFLGLSADHPEREKINTALSDMVAASVGVVRVPIPGSLMYKGVKGREYMIEFLGRQIPERRTSSGDDIFTQLCIAEDDEGNSFTDQEIIDHMIFLWMAAHDTITSSMTTLVYEIGRHSEWQDKIRDEIKDLGLNDDRLPYEKMNEMTILEYCFKEALRLNPPVPSIARETVRDVEVKGHIIPKGTTVGISTVYTHRSSEYWDSPEDFDPLRFTPENSKGRHRYAWIPFGGGAHMCLGLHFAYMQTKVILAHLLPHYSIDLPVGYTSKFQLMPIIKPLDGLPVTLTKLDS